MINMYDIIVFNNGETYQMDVGIVVAIQHKAGMKNVLYQVRDFWVSGSTIKRVLGNAAELKEEIDMESEQ